MPLKVARISSQAGIGVRVFERNGPVIELVACAVDIVYSESLTAAGGMWFKLIAQIIRWPLFSYVVTCHS